MRFLPDEILQFGIWSSDFNPLHVDPEVARQTFFGRTVVHGILSVVRTLNGFRRQSPQTDEFQESRLRSLDVEFRGAAFPDVEYEVSQVSSGRNGDAPTGEKSARLSLELRGADSREVVLTLAGSSQDVQVPFADLNWVALYSQNPGDSSVRRLAPVERGSDELATGFEIGGVWHADTPIADYLADGLLGPTEARVLGLTSYLIGMELPGLRSLFSRLSLNFTGSSVGGESQSDPLVYRLRVVRYDARFRILDLRLEVATRNSQLIAWGELRSYVRFSPVRCDLGELNSYLAEESENLQGKVALVCGGSRGLGAELTAGLALAGCQVHASHRGQTADLEIFRQALTQRGLNVAFHQGDVGDPEWCAAVVADIVARSGRLDLLVLNACAPPGTVRVNSVNEPEFAAYVLENLRLASVPLSASLPALSSARGAVVAISSSFVDETPPGFSHYVALKQAVEGLVKTSVRETPALHAQVVRPPKLLTSWNDTPTGVLDAIPPSWVSAQVVNSLGRDWQSGKTDLLVDFPQPAIVEAAPRVSEANEFSIVVAASFTADPVLKSLRFWLRFSGEQGHAQVAPYGQVLQQLLDPASSLSTTTRGVGVVLIRVQDWLRELSEEKSSSLEFIEGFLTQTAQELVQAIRSHRGHARAETLLMICPSGAETIPGQARLFGEIENGLVADLKGVSGLRIVVASEHHARYAVPDDQVHDALREEIGHIPFQPAYFHFLGTIIARFAHRRMAPLRKVVVVDCDNTLWRGVVGEVGPEGVSFDESHRALQEKLCQLSDSGVLVCLCSKNEEFDVWSVFDSRGDFGLPRARVVGAMINWLPKSQNLKTLAARLNLGIDSFVFLDDNPVECAEVRAGAPEVLTLNFPTNPTDALRLLGHTWELDVAAGTQEDLKRTQMYQEELQRQELQSSAGSFRDFIDSLNLEVRIEPLASNDLARASQLTLRTNQFNFLTRRRDEGEFQSLLGTGRHDVQTVHVVDRFGDYGLVGLMIVETEGDCLFVDTFLLSCRVLGRGVEHRMAAEIGRLARERGLNSVRMRVETTKRNVPARGFLDSISSQGVRQGDEKVLECVFPAALLAELKWEPGEAPAAVPQEGGAPAASTAEPLSADSIRRRERQIARTVFELATLDELRQAIDGVGGGQQSESISSDDIPEFVTGVFARALKIPGETVTQVDQLEALGCGSFKIVEITVELAARFPWLPSTLLFEHRSVSEIISQIVALGTARGSRTQSSVSQRVAAAPQSQTRSLDIAVVGLNVKCSGVDSPEQLWNLIAGGGCSVTEVDPDRTAFLERLDDDRTHWAGQLNDIDQFDAEFFGVSPREAESLDPQLRLFLETAWGALEDAGLVGVDYELDTGVFVGLMYGDYVHQANALSRQTGNPYRSWEGFSLANRLSQVLGFRGPSFTVDTACSSSGTALHLACRALADGDCAAAVVGGVNLILDPERFVQLGHLGILSRSGKVQTFGAEADGTLFGEGAGVVVLKRLADATARGDRIYGVIRGSGLSSGNGTVGFTAPNPVAQSEAVRKAFRSAGIDPRTVSYVETHGTGTQLGDPIEVRGLELGYVDPTLFQPGIEGEQHCTLGSIKPNIGHLEAGAAVVGLIKVLLQLQHRELVPSLTSERSNPQIPFDRLPFKIQRSLTAWRPAVLEVDGVATEQPLRAALNSFGVGGANAHVIIDEAPPIPERATTEFHRPNHLVVVSARNATALTGQLERLREYLVQNPTADIADVAFTLAMSRRHFEYRAAVPVRDHASAVMALGELNSAGETRGASRTESPVVGRPKIAFLFTGQGAQYVGMGRAFYDAHPVFRDALDRCAAVLDRLLPRPFYEILFAEEGTPDAELIHQTGYTQPALFAVEYALAELWRSWGIQPDVVLGHSVGEHTAMVVAGGMSLADGLKLIAARGRLMQALPAGGGMLSVMAGEAEVAAILSAHAPQLTIGALNGPTQTVVSGELAELDRLRLILEEHKIKSKALTVSHAFHSALMDPMLAEYTREAAAVKLTPPRIPFISCVLGRLVSTEVLSPDYWVQQVRNPVRFTTAMRTLADQQVTAFLETGPHPVMLAMGRQCLPELADSAAWLPSLRREGEPWPTILASLGSLFTRNAAIDWRGFDSPWPRRRVALPAYAFTRQSYWISPPSESTGESRTSHANRAGSPAARATLVESLIQGGRFSATEAALLPRLLQALDEQESTPSELDPSIGQMLYETVWRKQPTESNGHPLKCEGVWLLIGGDAGFSVELSARLTRSGANCRVVSTRDWDRLSPESALEKIFGATGPGPLRIVVATGLDQAALDEQAPEVVARRCGDSLARITQLVRLVVKADQSIETRLWLVTRGAMATRTGARQEPVFPEQTAVWGLGRTLALEEPNIWGGLIDLPAETLSGDLTDQVLREALRGGPEDQIALREDGRYLARLVRLETKSKIPAALSESGIYLVTGGLGALGLRMARWLIGRGARRLVLASRRGPETPRASEIVAELRELGAEVDLVAVDVTRAGELAELIDRLATNGSLRGVVHTAGTVAVAPLAEADPQSLELVLSPKLVGGGVLHERTKELPLDLFICFSSISATLGSAGLAHYGAANAFLDGLVQERRRLGLCGVSIAWGPWRGGGMASEEELRQLERMGNRGLTPEAALEALDRLRATDTVQATVADIDWGLYKGVYEARRERPFVSEVGDSPTASQPASRSAVSPSGPPWLVRLAGEPPERRSEVLKDLLRAEIARTLGLSGQNAVVEGKTFYEMGLDSLLATEFANRLHKQLGIRNVGLVFAHPRLPDLAAHLAQTISIPQAGVESADATPAPSTALIDKEWVALLKQAPAAERVSRLAALLKIEVAQTLGLGHPSKVPAGKSFSEMGLDSLLASELANRLHRRLGVRNPALAFLHPNVDLLAEHLVGTFPLESTAGSELHPVSGLPTAVTAPPSGVELYRPRWRPALLRFLREEFPDRDPALLEPRWNWMYVQSARRLSRDPKVWLYAEGERVVGHHGSIPVELQIGTVRRPTAWFVDTRVSADHRGRAIGPQLVVEGDADLPFALSLGQTEEMRGILLRLGWRTVAPLQTAQLLIRPEKVLRSKLPYPAVVTAGLYFRAQSAARAVTQGMMSLLDASAGSEIRTIDRFESRHDTLWTDCSRDFSCATVRDASFLNWKWVDQPGQTFVRIEIIDHDECHGIAVLQIREPDSAYPYRRAFLTDLVVSLSQERRVRRLLAAAVQTAADKGADSLVCLHINPPLTQALRRVGFLIREPARHLLIHTPESLPEDELKRLLDGRNWFVTQADSDIDRP